jgi:hypothetical protein
MKTEGQGAILALFVACFLPCGSFAAKLTAKGAKMCSQKALLFCYHGIKEEIRSLLYFQNQRKGERL